MYNPRIPPQLESLVLRALSKEPDGRPTIARDFARQLSSYRDIGDQATVVGPVAPRPIQQPNPRPATPNPRPISTGPTSPRPVLQPPARSQAPPDNRGMGFGGFLLGLLLLVGVLGLVYAVLSGAFNDLFNFATGAPRPFPTIVAGEPTASPELPTGVRSRPPISPRARIRRATAMCIAPVWCLTSSRLPALP
jgi:eukaryotic-like serine/threonine-protein kinase